jgi:hypothetical protein
MTDATEPFCFCLLFFADSDATEPIKYTIPQLNGTKLGWVKRKNNGKKMIFESPFKTGIKIINYINDEQLDSLVEEYTK